MKEVLLAIVVGGAGFILIKACGQFVVRWLDRRRLAKLRRQVDAAHQEACRRFAVIQRQRSAISTVNGNGKANL